MTINMATISGAFVRPDLGLGAMTVYLEAATVGSRLTSGGTVVAGKYGVVLDASGNASVTIPQLPQASILPADARWRLVMLVGNDTYTKEFTLSTDTTWGALTDVSGVPITSSILQQAIAARDQAAAYAATLAGVSGVTWIGDVSVKDPLYGAVGDGTTDDTAAIQAALNYLTGITAFDGRSTKQPILRFPPGRYRVRSGFTAITNTKVRIVGAGENASQIWYDPTTDSVGAVVFDFGTFSATPGSLFTGNQDVIFENIRIQHASPSAAGSRKGQAIRSSGGGGLILKNVAVYGFKYGVNCPYGGDFNHYSHATAEVCDVGFYLGPGSQQVLGEYVNGYQCVEGMVIDRVAHLHLTTPIFNGCGTSGITLEAITDTTTRQLTSFSASGTSYCDQIVLNTPWFESNPGGLGDTATPTHYIQCSDGGTDAYRNVTINNAYCVGAGPTKTTTSLIGSISGNAPQQVRIVRPVLVGALTNWAFGISPDLIDAPFTASGYTAPAMSSLSTGWLEKAKTASGEETWQTGLMPIIQKFERNDHAHGVAFEHGLNGILRLAFESSGTWNYRMGFDIQNRRYYLDDPNTASSASITRSSSIPTSGSFGIGSFVFNTAPSISAGKVLLGWLRLTTGSAHVSGTDWTPFWGTTT